MKQKYTKNKCCGHSWWRCIGFGILGVAGFIALALLFGFIIMWLWNALIPELFNIGVITFWQAVGLAILARLLFGASHFGKHHFSRKRWKHHQWHSGDSCDCGCESGHNQSHSHYHGSKDKCNCDTNSWQYYEQYWEEEGEKAYQEYVKRKTENSDKQEN